MALERGIGTGLTVRLSGNGAKKAAEYGHVLPMGALDLWEGGFEVVPYEGGIFQTTIFVWKEEGVVMGGARDIVDPFAVNDVIGADGEAIRVLTAIGVELVRAGFPIWFTSLVIIVTVILLIRDIRHGWRWQSAEHHEDLCSGVHVGIRGIERSGRWCGRIRGCGGGSGKIIPLLIRDLLMPQINGRIFLRFFIDQEVVSDILRHNGEGSVDRDMEVIHGLGNHGSLYAVDTAFVGAIKGISGKEGGVFGFEILVFRNFRARGVGADGRGAANELGNRCAIIANVQRGGTHHQEKRFLVIAASQDLSYLIVYVTLVSISVVYVVTCSCCSIDLYLCNSIYCRF
jgi:hypothetical protein